MISFLRTVKKSGKLILARLNILDPFREPFKNIEFETTTFCNRKCVYCPNYNHKRTGAVDEKYMSEEVFQSFLDQLCDIGFKGLISPHLYGEPLTDPRIEDWVKRIRKRLPQCRIKIVTNGDYLDRQKYDRLIKSGVDFFHVSKHGKKHSKGVKELLSGLPMSEQEKRLRLLDFNRDYERNQTMFTNRGGEVELKQKKSAPVCCAYAVYPVINTFGDIILCCQDYHGSHVSGNIMERHLKDIWWDPVNVSLRKRIYKGYFDLPLCKKCEM